MKITIKKLNVYISFTLLLPLLLILMLNFGHASVTYEINATDTDYWTLFTFVSPANNSIYYNLSTEYAPFLNMTTNNTFVECKFMWDMNGTYFNLANDSAANNSWSNASAYTFFDNTPNTWHNFTFYCHNASAANATFTNSSLFRYQVFSGTGYEIADNTVISNNSVYSSQMVLNISTNRSVSACYYIHNNSAAVEMGNSTPHNTTAGHTNYQYWTNGSAWSGIPDTAFGQSHNVTFYCEDAYGNKTWINTSAAPPYYYKLDTATPKIEMGPTYTLGNGTGGNYIQVEFNISDNTPGACWVELYFEDGTTLNTSAAATYNNSLQYANCTINITASDLSKDGYAAVIPSTVDAAGNYNNTTSVSSQNYIFYRLKTGYNLVTGYENKTLSEIAGEFANVSYVSVWDNVNKSFSTFTVGTSTNANIRANITSQYSEGAAYIYVSSDLVSMRRHYTPPTSWLNATLYENSTAARTSWNIVGVTKYVTDLNATIMADACHNQSTTTTNETINFTANNTGIAVANPYIISVTQIANTSYTFVSGNWSYNDSYVWILDLADEIDELQNYNVTYTWTAAYSYANCANVTWVAWWDTQNGEFCSFLRNRLSAGCNYRSNQINLTRGDAIWIAVKDVNITLDRNAW